MNASYCKFLFGTYWILLLLLLFSGGFGKVTRARKFVLLPLTLKHPVPPSNFWLFITCHLGLRGRIWFMLFSESSISYVAERSEQSRVCVCSSWKVWGSRSSLDDLGMDFHGWLQVICALASARMWPRRCDLPQGRIWAHAFTVCFFFQRGGSSFRSLLRVFLLRQVRPMLHPTETGP